MKLFATLKYLSVLGAFVVSSQIMADTTTTNTAGQIRQEAVTGNATTGLTTTTQISTDEEISKKVKDILSAHQLGLTATVSEGVINLTGTLSDASKLKEVVEAAKAIPGVQEVKLDGVQAAEPALAPTNPATPDASSTTGAKPVK